MRAATPKRNPVSTPSPLAGTTTATNAGVPHPGKRRGKHRWSREALSVVMRRSRYGEGRRIATFDRDDARTPDTRVSLPVAGLLGLLTLGLDVAMTIATRVA